MKKFPSVIQEERGSGLVEYAVVFLLLMTLVLGMVDFSRAIYAYHFISNQARDASRYASVRGSTCTDDAVQLYGGKFRLRDPQALPRKLTFRSLSRMFPTGSIQTS